MNEPSTVTYTRSALNPEKREVKTFCRKTLAELAPTWDIPFICFVDSKVVLRRDWDVTVWHGHVVMFVDVSAIPQGGGGGSNPLRIIAMLAVVAFAAWAGPWTAGYLGFAPGGMMGTALTGVGVIGGTMLVNAVLPVTTPNAITASQAAPSPTYNLQAQGNFPRLGQPVPEHFGRHICFPDWWSDPYAEAHGNEVYLYQDFCVSRGKVAIEVMRIENTDISSFDDIEYEIIEPGGYLTLFPGNVDVSGEVSGQDLPGKKAATYTRSGTTITINLTAHGLLAGEVFFFQVVTGGASSGTQTVVTASADSFTITSATSGTITTSNCHVQFYVGPFVAGDSGSAAIAIGVDFAAPKGLFQAQTSSTVLLEVTARAVVELQEIDDDGTPIGSWSALDEFSYSGKTTTPQRYSERATVTSGRYQARARRTDVEQDGSLFGHDLVWSGLRSYLPDTGASPDVTRWAVKARASSQLSAQSSRKFNLIATRKLPIWDGSSWSEPQPTCSIAWAAAYVCKQVGIPDYRIDLAQLLYLDGIWAARGDECNGRIDSFMGFWDALTRICDAGRCKPFIQGGVIRFHRDQLQTQPVMPFTMRNIVRGSFSFRVLTPTEDTADSVEIGYFDSATWKPKAITATLPDSTALKPVRRDVYFVTNRDRAYERGLYEAANNQRRRIPIVFQTEMEGAIPSYGDLITIQHDMPGWGQHAEVVGVETTSNHLTSSNDFANAAWTKTATGTGSIPVITSNAADDPFGNQTADKVDFVLGGGTTATDASRLRRQTVGTSVVGSPSAQSVMLKTVDGSTKTLSFGFVRETSEQITVTGEWAKFEIVLDSAVTTTAAWSLRALGNYNGGEDVSVYICWASRVDGSNVVPEVYVETTLDPAYDVPVLELSEPMTFTTGNHYIGFRAKNGSSVGPHLAHQVYGDEYKVVLPEGMGTFEPYSGSDYERTHVAFGVAETWSQRAIVLGIRPKSRTIFEIEAINEDDSVHTADQGYTLPAPVTSNLIGYTAAPHVEGLIVRSSPEDVNLMLMSWKPSPWAEYYLIEISADRTNWTRVGEPSGNNFTATAVYGSSTYLRVAAVGATKGPWIEVGYGGSADYMWSAGDGAENMWNTGDDAEIMWT